MPRQKRKDVAGSAGKRRRHFLAYKRRWGVWGGLFLLIAGLIAYNYFTQDERVRAALESVLSARTGGKVQIGEASFSIVRGLRVADVTIDVDDRKLDDSRLMEAQKLNIEVNYLRLLWPETAIGSIEAVGVRLRLCEDPVRHTWNFERLFRKEGSDSREGAGAEGPSLDTSNIPTVHIRDAMVKYLRREKDVLRPLGDVRADATIFPMPQRRYGFNVMAQSDGKRTRVLGLFDRRSERLAGKVSELRFDQALRRMLPMKVEKWFDELDFAGRFSVPHFEYQFAAPGRREQFQITLSFEDTRATIQPRTWLTQKEQTRKALLGEAVRVFEMLGMDRDLPHGATAKEDDDVVPLKASDYLQLHLRSIPVRWSDVNGQITFTQNQINIERLAYRVQGQAIEMAGNLQGYDLDSPATISLKTAPGTFVQVPPSRQFMAWLPEDVRKVYMQFKPVGKARLDVQLARHTPGGAFVPVVNVDLSDAQIEFEDFPYPLQRCAGRFVFRHDEQLDEDMLRIEHLIGYGVPGGPNVNSTVEVNGVIGPFSIKGGPGVDVTVTGTSIHSEPKIRETFPKEVAAAMKLFGPPDYGKRQAQSGQEKLALGEEEKFLWPEFHGDFSAKVHRDAGPYHGVNTSVDLRLDRATGCLKSFPYPMHDLSCMLHINDDHLVIENLVMNRGDARLKLDGEVTFSEPTITDIKVEALNVPIDDDLLDALPAEERSWIRKGGLGGHVDIVGRVFVPEGPPGVEEEVDFGLNLRLIDGTILREATGPAIGNANGEMFLQPGRLQIRQVEGRRGNAKIKASGELAWRDGTPDAVLKIEAENLLLDKGLHDLLPAGAQGSWDEQQPEGTADVDVEYTLITPSGQAASACEQPSQTGLVRTAQTVTATANQGRLSSHVGAQEAELPSLPVSASNAGRGGLPTTRSALPVQTTEKVKLDIRPRQLAATSSAFPYRLENLQGRILVDDKQVRLIGLTGTHGKTEVKIDADGVTGEKSDFKMRVLATGVQFDDELMLALPEAVADTVDSLEADGTYMVRFDDLRIRTGEGPMLHSATSAATASTQNVKRKERVARRAAAAATQAATAPTATATATATTRPVSRSASTQPVDVDFSCVITGMDAKLNVGFPTTDVNGWAQLTGQVRNSELVELDGTVSADSYNVLGRQGSMLTATLKRPRNYQGLLVQSIRSDLAGGSAAADVTLLTPTDAPSQYAVQLTIQNAEMSEVAGDAMKQPMHGTLSANFDAEGVIGDSASRQGRGRIEIRGQGMYEAPVVLGFFRLVNLGLPLREGVNEVDISYTLMGERATFDSVEMRAPGLRIYGDGLLDFGTRKVNFTLNTENPDSIKLPLLTPIARRIQQELLQIHIGGTISEPQVRARSLPTFQATLDQVLEDVKRPGKEK